MKRKFNLQMFAEDTTTAAEVVAENATTTKAEGEGKRDKAADEKKYSDADVNALIDRKFAEWQKKQNKAVEDAKTKEKEAAKLAAMNAQEKAEYERDQLQKELDGYKKKDALAEMTKTARKMLSDEGITISDDLLAVMVTTEAAETKAAVDSFTKAFKAAVENAVKERLKGNPPTKGASGGAAAMTKEQIMAIRDPELRQKKMIENRHLFNF